MSLSDLKEAIHMHLHDDITNKRMVDVSELARRLQAQYPQINLQELSEHIFETVVAAGGNAQWDKK